MRNPKRLVGKRPVAVFSFSRSAFGPTPGQVLAKRLAEGRIVGAEAAEALGREMGGAFVRRIASASSMRISQRDARLSAGFAGKVMDSLSQNIPSAETLNERMRRKPFLGKRGEEVWVSGTEIVRGMQGKRPDMVIRVLNSKLSGIEGPAISMGAVFDEKGTRVENESALASNRRLFEVVGKVEFRVPVAGREPNYHELYYLMERKQAR